MPNKTAGALFPSGEASKIDSLRCELVGIRDISRLEGKLKTQIDSMGLGEKQGEATKDITHTILWDWFNFIAGHKTDYLNDKKKWYGENKWNYKSDEE